MPLLDGLTASGVTPGRMRKLADFFADHPGLADEIRACRAAGYSWRQITGQLSVDYGAQISTTALADAIEGR